MGGSSSTVSQYAFFVVYSLVCGAVMLKLEHATAVPYTVLMMLSGIILALLYAYLPDSAASLLSQKNAWENVTAPLMLILFIPPLVFQSAMKVHYFIFKKSRWQVLVLASGVLLLSTALASCMLYGLVLWWGKAPGFNVHHALVLGSIVSATDPVAVVALLESLGASPVLGTMIEGESLLNDGAAMVLFFAFREQCIRGEALAVDEYASMLVRLTVMAFAIGWAMGWAMAGLIKAYRDSFIMLSYITISGCFGTFFLSAYHPPGMIGPLASEILACVVAGLHVAGIGKLNAAPLWGQVEHLWEFIASMLNTVLFCLLGVLIVKAHADHGWVEIGKDLLFQGVVYVGLHVVRFIAIFAFLPLLRQSGYAISRNEGMFMAFGGLRGAIGIALGINIYLEPNEAAFPRPVKNLFEETVAGVALLTLMINGNVAGRVLRLLGLLEKDYDLFTSVTDQVSEELYLDKVVTVLAEDLGECRCHAFRHADWNIVVSTLMDAKGKTEETLGMLRERVTAAAGRPIASDGDGSRRTPRSSRSSFADVDSFLLVGRHSYHYKAHKMYQERTIAYLEGLAHSDCVRPEAYHFLLSCAEYKLDHLGANSFSILLNMLANGTKSSNPDRAMRLGGRLMTPFLPSSDVVYECVVVFVMVHLHVQDALKQRLAMAERLSSEDGEVDDVTLVLGGLLEDSEQDVQEANDWLDKMAGKRGGRPVRAYATAIAYFYARAKIAQAVEHLREDGDLTERVAEHIAKDLRAVPRDTFYRQRGEWDWRSILPWYASKAFEHDEFGMREAVKKMHTQFTPMSVLMTERLLQDGEGEEGE